MGPLMWAWLLGCGEPCASEGATRCADQVVETCEDGRWRATADCAAAGQVCMQEPDMADGEAHCMIEQPMGDM